jgi:ATP-dependent exoDNAse (exonuclease V) beta subunit
MDEDYSNFKLKVIRDFLELSIAECPHQVFKDSETRSSEFKKVFDLDQVRVVRKHNRACEIAKFVMQAVANNKLRHEKLQEFMFFSDSTTVAVEVPVLLDKDDLWHYKKRLNFKVPIELEKDDDVITGHIDIVQVRNGIVHILDFKPSASREKPIAQLTLYALALARLTSLKLYNFKCAWFDEDDYYEFFPLHVVYKKKKKGKRKFLNG